jgi:hypothetical protein
MAHWPHDDGGWKSRGRGTDRKGAHVDQVSSLYIFRNLPLKPEKLEQAWHHAGQITVTQALFLDARSWPLIPLKAGGPVTECVGDCFAIAIVRCSGPEAASFVRWMGKVRDGGATQVLFGRCQRLMVPFYFEICLALHPYHCSTYPSMRDASLCCFQR